MYLNNVATIFTLHPARNKRPILEPNSRCKPWDDTSARPDQPLLPEGAVPPCPPELNVDVERRLAADGFGRLFLAGPTHSDVTLVNIELWG